MQGQCIGMPLHAAATWLINEQAISSRCQWSVTLLAKVNDSWWYL